MEIVKQNKGKAMTMKEDSLKHTMKQVAGDDVNVCFITAYQGARPKEENEAANEELAKDIRRLGYGFTKTVGGFQYGDGSIGHEPGFKVAIKNPNPEKFVEEMMALGKKYGQESVLIKVPGDKAKYYNTSDNFGNIDMEFDSVGDANPQDTSTWTGGYTQMRKDLNKNPTKAFKLENGQDEDGFLTLTEEEINELPEFTEKTGGRNIKTGNGWIVCHLCRRGLGLE